MFGLGINMSALICFLFILFSSVPQSSFPSSPHALLEGGKEHFEHH